MVTTNTSVAHALCQALMGALYLITLSLTIFLGLLFLHFPLHLLGLFQALLPLGLGRRLAFGRLELREGHST